MSVGIISTLLADHGSTSTGSAASTTVTDQFVFSPNNDVRAVPTSVLSALRAIRGVTGVTSVHVAPSAMHTSAPVPDINGLGGDVQDGVASCG